jgi:hypothetical protein
MNVCRVRWMYVVESSEGVESGEKLEVRSCLGTIYCA